MLTVSNFGERQICEQNIRAHETRGTCSRRVSSVSLSLSRARVCLACFFSLIEIGELLEFEGCIHWVFHRIVIIPADRATHTPEPAVNDALTIFHTISVVFVRSQNVWIC